MNCRMCGTSSLRTITIMPAYNHANSYDHAHRGIAEHKGTRMTLLTPMSTGTSNACRNVLYMLQGDAFTFGSAESIPRSAMRRRSVIHKHKGQLASPEKSQAHGNPGRQPLSNHYTGKHDTA